MNAAQNESVTLTVSKRDAKHARQLRALGLVPLELYGHETKNASLQVDHKTLAYILREHGTTTLIDLTVDQDQPVKVLIKEPQFHPVTHHILHADMYKVNLKEKITSEIPLNFVGESPAVDDLGGTLIETKTNVEVECLPQDLPHELNINISKLKTFEDVLHVSDIKVPTGVEILDEANEVVASVAEPRSEEELAALDEAVEADVDSVEVEEKGKEGEEGEAGEGEGEGEAATTEAGNEEA